ncbi:hypothetical protein VTO42DRAFT_1868 [Malbranchea cinnamomea]
MREVNFSIPNVNKASVNITPTLYDRRALDCTSTLPLVNSLNHLAYLTTSSARIREILTVDGGIEQLICILKAGRSRDMMELWKWNLAFQCIVNIGVRGSEAVRTRLVEADVVPVIATLLDNYVRVVEKIRAMDAEQHRMSLRCSLKPSSSSARDPSHRQPSGEQRIFRRHPPPSLEIPLPFSQETRHQTEEGSVETTHTPPVDLTSPSDRNTLFRDHPNRGTDGLAPRRRYIVHPLAFPTVEHGVGPRPVRDADQLQSMVPGLQAGAVSQPESPITPHGAAGHQSIPDTIPRRRPSLRQQISSTSADSDDANVEDVTMGDDMVESNATEPIVGLQNAMEVDNAAGRDSMLDDGSEERGLAMPNPSEGTDAETFNITHRSPADGSIINAAAQAGDGTLALSPARPGITATAPLIQQAPYPIQLRDRLVPQAIIPAMPRDEDVLMALQLLAYVSKYTSLRTYFQQTHLVPRLKIGKEIQLLDDSNAHLSFSVESDEDLEEYTLPDDFNVFPLVEKFTARQYTKDMQYWACVVMRNLCRKDESRGGIRQCAWYKCGKWEETPRQFAKCRRCRRTKYCSKECQKNAWVYHRHWCHSPTSSEQQQPSQQQPQPSQPNLPQ